MGEANTFQALNFDEQSNVFAFLQLHSQAKQSETTSSVPVPAVVDRSDRYRIKDPSEVSYGALATICLALDQKRFTSPLRSITQMDIHTLAMHTRYGFIIAAESTPHAN